MSVRSAALLIMLLSIPCQAGKPVARARQRFVVHVPPKAAIVAPQDVAVVHDGTDSPQAFPSQSWQVSSTYPSGLSVDFATQSTFQNRQIADAQRDVQLELSVGTSTGAGTWTIVAAQDQSAYLAGDQSALVRAESNGPGQADLLLAVVFLTGDRSTLPSGDYELTVTATVSANP